MNNLDGIEIQFIEFIDLSPLYINQVAQLVSSLNGINYACRQRKFVYLTDRYTFPCRSRFMEVLSSVVVPGVSS